MNESLNTSTKDLDRIWTETWRGLRITDSISAIQKDENMRWKLKYAPSHGRFLEAGCGVGQYVLYFKKLGFDIKGIDISKETVSKSIEDATELGFGSDLFEVGDVRKLPYENNSLSYYLSMGVVEHFREGPMNALTEAYRVLKPGGIAYIATPTKYSLAHANSLNKWMFALNKLPQRIIKLLLLNLKIIKPKDTGWVENLWTLNELKDFVQKAKFIVVDTANTGLKSTFETNCRPSKKYHNIILNKSKRFLYPLIDNLEDGNLAKFGMNNIIIAIKPGKEMGCFFCGNLRRFDELNLGEFSVPMCDYCHKDLPIKVRQNYLFRKRPYFKERRYTKKENYSDKKNCEACNCNYKIDPVFGDFGFTGRYCLNCIKKKEISIQLRNLCLKYENKN